MAIEQDAGPAALTVPPPRPLSYLEVRSIICGMMLAMFLAALNQTIVATALPTIGRDFDDFENLPWVVTAFLLASTAVAPLYGKLSDIYGRRTMLLTGLGLFTAGSVMCALAPNMLLLSLGRAVQGIGGGGIMPLAQTVIADASTPRERGRYQALIGSFWVSAGIAGPLVGGFIAEHLPWSMIFWLNVPLGLLGVATIHSALKKLPRHDRKHRLDLVGAALMMIAAIALLLALAWGGTRYSWASPQIALLLFSCVLFVALFGWRLRHAPEPFLPLPILRDGVVRMGTAASACAVGASLALTIYLPLYFQVVHKLSVAMSGLALIPLVAMTTPGSILSGRALEPLRALQAGADRRALARDRGGGVPRAVADRADLAGGRGTHRHQHGLRRHLSGVHRERAERGAVASGRDCDRGDELLPRADERARGRDPRRHRRRRLRRRHGARPRRRRGGAGGLGARRRRLAHIRPDVRRRRPVSGDRTLALILMEERPLRGPSAS